MSRAYRICISESVRRHVRVEDGVQTRLEVLAVLPEGDMAELIAKELEKLGLVRDGDVLSRTDEDGVEITVDPKTATVTVRLAAEGDVDQTVERSARIYEEHLEKGKQALRERVERELEAHVEAERDRLTEEVAKVLEAKLRDLHRELDGAATRATAEALKIRAGQLGEVTEVSENEETGELTIKVKV